jgi:hypothetical protein
MPDWILSKKNINYLFIFINNDFCRLLETYDGGMFALRCAKVGTTKTKKPINSIKNN